MLLSWLTSIRLLSTSVFVHFRCGFCACLRRLGHCRSCIQSWQSVPKELWVLDARWGYIHASEKILWRKVLVLSSIKRILDIGTVGIEKCSLLKIQSLKDPSLTLRSASCPRVHFAVIFAAILNFQQKLKNGLTFFTLFYIFYNWKLIV